MQFVLFTDNLSDLTVRDTCRAAKKAGFDGLDLTLRPGGHVLPGNAAAGLAAAHAIADEEGVSIPMVSTNIVAADSPHAEDVIAAAHDRIRRFKLGYWRYQPFGNLAKQLDEARRQLQGIVRLTTSYQIRPCIHIHSGPILANGPWVYLLVKDYSPEEVGIYVDPMHMSVEGALSGWEMTLDMIAPWVSLVGVKNYRLDAADRDAFGQQRYQVKYVPIADGVAPLPQFFMRLKQIGYDGVVSLHSEYKGGGSWRKLTTPELLGQSAEDLRYLKQLVARI